MAAALGLRFGGLRTPGHSRRRRPSLVPKDEKHMSSSSVDSAHPEARIRS